MKDKIHGGDVYRHKNALDFSANMNPLGTPEAVIRAAAESLREIHNYPDIRMEALRQGLSAYEQVPEDYLVCGNGAAEVIFMLALALRPRRALLPAPTFAEYEQALRLAGTEISYFELKEEEGFRVTERILEAITPGTEFLMLCNPNNPTGTLIEPELMGRILERCRRTDTFLAVDECFQDFIEEPERYTLKAALKDHEKLFLLKAFTKRYAMAGIRLGYGICSDLRLLEAMRDCVQPWNVSIPAQEAGLAALEEGDYVKEARRLVFRESAWLKEQLKALGYPVYDSQANYIFFRGEETLGECLLKKQIMVRDCSNYRGLEKGYYRIAVRTRRENEALLAAVRKVREEWQKQS